MAQERISQRWENFRPSKAVWLWSCLGCIALTMIVGFTLGGWVTGGSAKSMSENAAEGARTDLVASLCVDKFAASPDAKAQLAKLKEASSYERDNFIEDGGWSKIQGINSDVSGVADACAANLVAMEELPMPATAPAEPGDANKG